MTQSKLAQMIDHTLLKPEAKTADFEKLCLEAKEFGFFSVCVPPAMIASAKQFLMNSEVKVCTVVGFPLGYTLPEAKAKEAAFCVAAGADEIDMVLNISAAKDENWAVVEQDIKGVVMDSAGRTVKVILETAYLSDEQKVKACKAAENAGAHFVKTSTGFAGGGATENDVRLMRNAVSAALQVKASGGIRDRATAEKMIRAGATRLGTSASVAIVKDLAAQGGSY